ncbi:MAG: GTP cyclohydrolase I FolE [Bacteroidales bacterium]|nr:GTP cyclohydrolase I FolE [Bacteroidales bacterium]
MKLNGQALRYKLNGNSPEYNNYLHLLGDNHIATSLDTPLRQDAEVLDENSKIELISRHFKEIMQILGLDMSDDSLQGTPDRVAKMYVKEIFSGLNQKNKPEIQLFENKFHYNEMLVEKDIKVHSTCEHHFVPIKGKAHMAYYSGNKIIGLSKINRIVDYFARRPQVQERLTVQIAEELKKVLSTDDIAVVIEADHMCVSLRGIKDDNSSTTTSSFSGKFLDPAIKSEFLTYISNTHNH